MRCTATVTRTGKQCRWPGQIMAGGLWVCEYHIAQALRLFAAVQARLGSDHPVVRAAEQDTAERNAS